MKKLFTITIPLSLFVTKSNAQTQFPFYGFELSNYEVGDSLEYSGSYIAQSYYSDYWTTLYTILNKEILSGDSIKYTIQVFTSGTTTNGDNHSYSSISTTSYIITNKAVYNNYNNILQYFLDTLPRDTIRPIYDSTNFHRDTAYVQFDTINGLKHLALVYRTDTLTFGYSATQDIGIESTEFETAGFAGLYGTYSKVGLEFYHLAHGGISGYFRKLITGISTPIKPETIVKIYYLNNLPVLSISDFNESLTSELMIYDLLGRTIKTQLVTTGNNQINITSLPKEMYLYKVTTGGNVIGKGKLMNIRD